MKQLIYAMQFARQAAPVAGSTTVLKAQTRALSCTLTSVIGPTGLSTSSQPATGSDAFFESEVTITGETSLSSQARYASAIPTMSFGSVRSVRVILPAAPTRT